MSDDELTKSRPPEFILPKSIDEMTDEEIDQALDIRRTLRLTAFVLYQKTEEELAEIRETKTKEKLVKKLAQLEKQFTAVDNALDKLQRYINDMRALKLQLGAL